MISSQVRQYLFKLADISEKRVLYVSVGDHDTSTIRDGSRYKLVSKYRAHEVSHPEYSGKTDTPAYDVAVLKLRVRIRFNSFRSANVRPICLPNPYEFRDSGMALVAGWGNTNYSGQFSEEIKTCANVETPFILC